MQTCQQLPILLVYVTSTFNKVVRCQMVLALIGGNYWVCHVLIKSRAKFQCERGKAMIQGILPPRKESQGQVHSKL